MWPRRSCTTASIPRVYAPARPSELGQFLATGLVVRKVEPADGASTQRFDVVPRSIADEDEVAGSNLFAQRRTVTVDDMDGAGQVVGRPSNTHREKRWADRRA